MLTPKSTATTVTAARDLSEGIDLLAELNQYWHTHTKTINDDHLWDNIIKPHGYVAHLDMARIAQIFIKDHRWSPTMNIMEQERRVTQFTEAVIQDNYWDAINIRPKRKRHPHKTAMWSIITQLDEQIEEWATAQVILFREATQ